MPDFMTPQVHYSSMNDSSTMNMYNRMNVAAAAAVSEQVSVGSSRLSAVLRRPLSAYNIFFQLERRRIINEEPERSLDDAEIKELLAEQRILRGQPKAKRLHRKTHGKVTFKQLATSIANNWKSLDAVSKEFYESYANIEKKRYEEEKKARTAESTSCMPNEVPSSSQVRNAASTRGLQPTDLAESDDSENFYDLYQQEFMRKQMMMIQWRESLLQGVAVRQQAMNQMASMCYPSQVLSEDDCQVTPMTTVSNYVSNDSLYVIDDDDSEEDEEEEFDVNDAMAGYQYMEHQQSETDIAYDAAMNTFRDVENSLMFPQAYQNRLKPLAASPIPSSRYYPMHQSDYRRAAYGQNLTSMQTLMNAYNSIPVVSNSNHTMNSFLASSSSYLDDDDCDDDDDVSCVW